MSDYSDLDDEVRPHLLRSSGSDIRFIPSATRLFGRRRCNTGDIEKRSMSPWFGSTLDLMREINGV